MASNKPGQTNDPIWDQHLNWLDLVGNECKANQLKRRRQKAREESLVRNPDDIARPPA